MSQPITRRTLLAAGLCAATIPGVLRAAGQRYDLVETASEIAFGFQLNGVSQTGTVPVASADIQVDTRNLAASKADVSADIRGARTGFVFVTQALLSPEVLDAANHPLVRFQSTTVRLGAQGRISDGARIEGNLTMRGVTKLLSLDATIARPRGTEPDDLDRLLVHLTGTLDRRDFGAAGYPLMVPPLVTLDIRAEIRASA
ncbi:MAG: YceI family protein [Pseudomonadota bacterium]